MQLIHVEEFVEQKVFYHVRRELIPRNRLDFFEVLLNLFPELLLQLVMRQVSALRHDAVDDLQLLGRLHYLEIPQHLLTGHILVRFILRFQTFPRATGLIDLAQLHHQDFAPVDLHNHGHECVDREEVHRIHQ